ncbi:MAG TPA: threonine/serine dehydratase [Magnetospirillaceae bacterium]|jgi:threonine dehydratase
MSTTASVTREVIAAMDRVIRPRIRRTPIVAVDLADFGRGAHPVTLKLECLQHSGSFKVRGAFANLMTRKVPDVGVVAASGGNHGAAVAYAARQLGVPATIFVPSVTSPEKARRIRSYGAELVIGGDRYADALAASQIFVEEKQALAIHAYDQVETLLGQGTAGLEIEEDIEGVDTVLVAVGGGGLIGGVAAWFAGRAKIVAVEPELCPTLWRALEAGRPVDTESSGIAADSLAPKRVGELMFPIAQRFVTKPVLVSDAEIHAAQVALWDAVRVVAEPGGAAAFAALLSGKYAPRPGERVAVLVCGANTTAVKFD